MIANEQLIGSELLERSTLLESTVEKTEQYLISLDKLYIAITKSKQRERFFLRNVEWIRLV